MSIPVFFLMSLAFFIAQFVAMLRLKRYGARFFTRMASTVGIVAMLFYMAGAGYILLFQPNPEDAEPVRNAIYLWGFFGAFPSLVIAGLDYLHLRDKRQPGAEPALLATAVLAAQTYFSVWISGIDSLDAFFAVYFVFWPLNVYGYMAAIWVIGILGSLWQPSPQVTHSR